MEVDIRDWRLIYTRIVDNMYHLVQQRFRHGVETQASSEVKDDMHCSGALTCNVSYTTTLTCDRHSNGKRNSELNIFIISMQSCMVCYNPLSSIYLLSASSSLLLSSSSNPKATLYIHTADNHNHKSNLLHIFLTIQQYIHLKTWGDFS